MTRRWIARPAGRGIPCGSRAVLVILLTAIALAAGCTTYRDAAGEQTVVGPEWNTRPRHGPGAADPAEPARLTAITVEEHAGYDRLLISFEGHRPGYRVEYSGDRRLTVLLRNVDDDRGQSTTPSLPAITEVQRAPAADGLSRTSMGLAAAALPFRIGLQVGAFYVDVGHPGATATVRHRPG